MTGKLRIAILCLLLACSTVSWAQESESDTASSSDIKVKADAEIEKARELLKQGYFDSAVVKYQDAFKIAPRYTVPYEELGKLMMEKRNFAYAIQMYSKLKEIEPKNPGYHKVLFSLYDAYDAPDDALSSGEVLLDMGEADSKMIERMAELYGKVERNYEKAQMMQLFAEQTEADAEYWNSVANAYSVAGKPFDAEEAALKALELEPGNDKYRNSLARIYADQGKTDKAEEIFAELSEKSPEDQGLKDELAQLYAQQGDAYLQRGRANTALEYYDKAEATGAADDDPDATGASGTYEGTVNTTSQIFRTSANAPGLGVGSYRLGATSFTTLGDTLEERRDSAELLLRPQYLFNANFGNQDINSYTQLENVVRVPIRGTELDLRVKYGWRDVSDGGVTGSASRDFIFAGANYNWNKDWSTQAYVGSEGLYDVTTVYEGDIVRGGLVVERDIWSYTPIALGNKLFYNRQGLFGGVSIGERFAIDGAVDLYQFNDGVDQTIYSIGPSYQVIIEPGVQELQVGYIYSSQSNSRFVNPLVRFAPRDLTANSIGLDYNRVLTDWWRMRAGYYYTWANDGTSNPTWNVGTDFRLWKGAWLGLGYERGAFANGVINPNLQSFDQKNDNLNVNFGVSF
jgi:tetratricopeptide (TPR) repeat protein